MDANREWERYLRLTNLLNDLTLKASRQTMEGGARKRPNKTQLGVDEGV